MDTNSIDHIDSTAVAQETEEQIIARHKKEAKDLIARITAMKKQATKKNKKEILRQSERLQDEMKRRHEEELAGVRGITVDVEENEDKHEEEFSPEKLLAKLELEENNKANGKTNTTSSPVSTTAVAAAPKRNRRKEKLAKRQEDIRKMQEEASKEASEQPDFRQIEMVNMTKLCELQGLVPHDSTPDGHCLFASIADQLQRRKDISKTVQELRTEAAQYIRSDPATFGPFLFDENTMTVRDIEPYCQELETTAMWGGDMEILALAQVYNCCISVLVSGRSTLKVNEEAIGNGELKLAYYKHSYGLGEHYNSLRDAK